jgi:hypothetical protein
VADTLGLPVNSMARKRPPKKLPKLKLHKFKPVAWKKPKAKRSVIKKVRHVPSVAPW